VLFWDYSNYYLFTLLYSHLIKVIILIFIPVETLIINFQNMKK